MFPGNGLLPGTALVKVVLQGTVKEDRFWPYVQIDIWRVNSAGRATNVADQVPIGQTINPCNGFGQVTSSEAVSSLGSEDLGVGRTQPISILMSNGLVLRGGESCACERSPYPR